MQAKSKRAHLDKTLFMKFILPSSPEFCGLKKNVLKLTTYMNNNNSKYEV